MAERTRKITKPKSTTKPVAKSPARTKKAVAINPQVNYLKVVGSKINNLNQRVNNLSQLQKLGIFAIIILILLAAYFKNLFVVAVVNGQPLTRLQVVGQLEKQGGQKALDDLVTKTLILQEGRKHKISVTQAEIDTQMKKYEDSVSAQGANFDEALSSQGLTRDSLRNNILLNKTIEKLIEKDITISDKDIDEYLSQNKDTLSKEASAEALRQEAKDNLKSTKQSEKAQELVARLKKEARINYFIKY